MAEIIALFPGFTSVGAILLLAAVLGLILWFRRRRADGRRR